jgi:pyruvate/2-oxoglutarate dehydrogenase complex dihydrolipoamide acyltransferase (E2) component
VAANPLAPDWSCGTCGQSHLVPVPYCPFCGSAQEARIALRQAATATPEPVDFDRTAAPPQAPAQTQVAKAEPARPVPQRAPPPTRRAHASPPRRKKLRLHHVVVAALLIEILPRPASRHRDVPPPPPARLTVGPAWTPVALPRFRGAPLWRITGDTAFSLRVDGERVLRVAQGEGLTVGTRMLRSLELRAPRPSAVTLTPERD